MNLIRIGNGNLSPQGEKGYTLNLSIPAQVKRTIGLKNEKVCIFYRDADSQEIVIRFEGKKVDDESSVS